MSFSELISRATHLFRPLQTYLEPSFKSKKNLFFVAVGMTILAWNIIKYSGIHKKYFEEIQKSKSKALDSRLVKLIKPSYLKNIKELKRKLSYSFLEYLVQVRYNEINSPLLEIISARKESSEDLLAQFLSDIRGLKKEFLIWESSNKLKKTCLSVEKQAKLLITPMSEDLKVCLRNTGYSSSPTKAENEGDFKILRVDELVAGLE